MIDLTKPLQIIGFMPTKPFTDVVFTGKVGDTNMVVIRSLSFGYFIFDLTTGKSANGIHFSLENVPPKTVMKTVTIYTAVMLSKYGRVFVVTHVDDSAKHGSAVAECVRNGATKKKSFTQATTIEVPEEFSGL